MRNLPFRQLGVALIEMAFVGPLLILLVLGVLVFGVALYDQSVITNASREGARKGVVAITSGKGFQMDGSGNCSETTGITTIAGAEATAKCTAKRVLAGTLISFGSSQIAIGTESKTVAGTSCASPNPNCALKVTVTYPYVGLFVFDAITLKASTSMFYE